MSDLLDLFDWNVLVVLIHSSSVILKAAKEKVKAREDSLERLGQGQSQSQIECKITVTARKDIAIDYEFNLNALYKPWVIMLAVCTNDILLGAVIYFLSFLQYYLRTGGCKFGKACRYNHTRAKSAVLPIFELNFLGLPIRTGEIECPYYMRNGSCKYGVNCKFNHPDPTAVGSSDPPSGFGNGGSVSSQAASQASVGSWSSPRALNDTASFVPMMFSPTQGVTAQNSEWNGYQAPLYPPPERNMHPAPAYVMNNPAMESTVYTHNQPHIIADEFPERPGQPECSYFLKTGDCKFKSNCKYHHPKNQISKSPPCALSDKGLPLRPEQNVCSHYRRYGICKFGPACRYHHPIELTALATDSGLDPSPPFGDSETTEEAGVAGTGNGSDNKIQQPV
ncbi:hypothetical protein EZV62_023869 [Acer yangbiense]|uniref:C3H1-type domain-containing protein n=1 Tax=Acer yangbiense TaxID=1000413 RepID=A0A5C7H3R1_9ROSI|nr:hypothetical protein EZV62_023869 [Acer yangbiense]